MHSIKWGKTRKNWNILMQSAGRKCNLWHVRCRIIFGTLRKSGQRKAINMQAEANGNFSLKHNGNFRKTEQIINRLRKDRN